ncbi:Gfo/Idh/MocA family protein [Austwickia chelonae]|uniref:Gfo/Idh/MocA family protein n=1 Tax=Austwickia chelonae TaxID=100225 RepID=UPI001FE0E379|nr:Gfo/Idh/MocA family oxidoreductase [Austwickia chelonae]
MRIALAGYAYGRTLHAPLIEEAGGQIVAVATSAPERAAMARADLPEARVVPDLEALLGVLSEVGADAVVLVTPTGRHAEHAGAVIDAGVPCVVDKPLACDATAAEVVVERARTARVPLTVFQNRRYDSGSRALATLLVDGVEGPLGRLRRFEMRYERWRPEPKQRWREQTPWQEGGGVLLDLASHVVDAAVQTMGRVVSVYAQVDAVTTVSEDDAVLHCRHVGGGTSILAVSSVAPAPGPRLRVIGSRAGYLWDHSDEGCSYPDLRDTPGHAGYLVKGATRRAVAVPPGGQADFYRSLACALSEPGGYSAAQAAMPVDPLDAVHTLAVIDAARVSAAENRVVEL